MADGVRSSKFAVKQSSLKTNSYQDGSSVKKLINEMCNGENTKHGRPGVVARLMGMDTSPPKTGPTIHMKECFDNNLRQHPLNASHCKGAKFDLCSLPMTAKKSPLRSLSSAKPPRQEHPHEEQLQKFKKEFEAWQESKLWEFSSNLSDYSSEDLKNEQILALENLKKEKMAVFANTCQRQKKPADTQDYVSVNMLKITPNQLHGFQNDGNFGTRRDLAAKSFELESSAKFQEKKIAPFSPTRIVILKPSSDSPEEPRGGLPEVVVKKDRSMEDFLEEVKEKLKLEIEGKGKSESTRRLSLGHTSLLENSTNPKHAAREAAKHGAMLRRSQSMITYRNSFHFDGEESSKSIKRETRKFISDRLKNVLKEDSITAFSKEGIDASFREDKKAVNEPIPMSLSLEPMKMESLVDEVMSPSNFVGSFSASFSEAQKLQKHEELKNDPVVVKKRKNDGFSIKSTVSNLRRNLGLRTKLFGKRVSSMGQSTGDVVHYVNPDETTPSVIRNFGIVQDNSTEVPPSPASFPCSPINEHYSPVSPLEDLFVDDRSSTQVSGELSMILTEFGSQPELAERIKCGIAPQTQLYNSNEKIPTDACAEAYIRDILLVSDLYSACWPLHQPTSRPDGQINPISSCFFDKVEEKSANPSNMDDENPTLSLGNIDINRKMLFDLVNEALPSALDAPLTQFLSKRMTTRGQTQFHHGTTLLDDLLDQIHSYVNPKADQPKSVEKLVVWDLKFVPWSTKFHEEVSSLCGEVEWVIIRELIDDLFLDLLV